MDESSDTIVSFERIIEVESPPSPLEQYIPHIVYMFVIMNIIFVLFIVLPISISLWQDVKEKLKRFKKVG